MNSIMNGLKIKACTKCKKDKPLTNQCYGSCKRSKSGLKASCKQCANDYRNANKKKINAYNRRYHKVKGEEVSQRKRNYYAENKDEILCKVREYGFIYREENREKIARKLRKYKRDNPEKIRIYKQKRRSLKRRLLSTLTVEQWEDTKIYFNNRCCYCGSDEKLTQDHFVPLSKNGEYTYGNIVPACISCNVSKGDRLFHEWYPT